MIDARGYSCPVPVVMVQKEIKANRPDTLEILVDNAVALQNILRLAGNNGYTAEYVPVERDYRITLTK